MKKILLSIIIPSYNEQVRLPIFLEEIFKEFNLYKDVEIILIDDGSKKENYILLNDKIVSLQKNISIKFRFERYEINRGKGGAIAYGIKFASGKYLAFIDADGATPARELRRAWDYLKINSEIDYLAGSRIVMFGRNVEKTFKRHLTSRIFSTYFTLIYGIKMYDPQCGMKIFQRKAYESVMSRITDFRWLWDTQLTVLLYRSNKYKMIEFPIDWKDIPGSKVNLLRDSVKMFFLLWKYRNLK